MKYILFTGCLMFVAHAFCKEDHPPSVQPSTANQFLQETRISGKVIETTNAAGYTYLQLDNGTKKTWVAVTLVAVKVVDSVVVSNAMAMPNYHSKTLNRDFDLVYFSGDVTINTNRSTTGDQGQAAEVPKNHPPITDLPEPRPMDFSGIKKARDGKTIAEIFANKAKLNGHQVTVRGKVVKYNAMIMGRNWVHLCDGTGLKGTDDLLVTTASAVKVGDTVLVTGSIALNRDFGSNYKYDVVMENAELGRE